MSIGLIARADDGGLGAQTWEFARHMRPLRTLVVHARHTSRGRSDPSRFADHTAHLRVIARTPTVNDITWLLNGVDVVYTAETWYTPQFTTLAAKDTRTVLHANPEMHDRRETADHVFVPTDWRRDLVPNAEVLPFPVATDRFTSRERAEVRTLYHVSSNAMCDRNGTKLLLAALQHTIHEFTLLIRGDGAHSDQRVGRSTVRWLGHHHGPYWEAWPEEVDLHVLPRRFGGLCLPLQEAAAQWLPTVAMDQMPYPLPAAAIAHSNGRPEVVRMKGGDVAVHACDPVALARRLDALADDPELVRGLSRRAAVWADSASWGTLAPRYREVFAT